MLIAGVYPQSFLVDELPYLILRPMQQWVYYQFILPFYALMLILHYALYCDLMAVGVFLSAAAHHHFLIG